jgi:hypothetical protein
MSEQTTTRAIAVFERASDTLVATVRLTGEEFESIREVLGYNADAPMYDSYPIQGNVLRCLRDLLRDRLPVGDYEYFLETEEA